MAASGVADPISPSGAHSARGISLRSGHKDVNKLAQACWPKGTSLTPAITALLNPSYSLVLRAISGRAIRQRTPSQAIPASRLCWHRSATAADSPAASRSADGQTPRRGCALPPGAFTSFPAGQQIGRSSAGPQRYRLVRRRGTGGRTAAGQR